MVMVRSMVEAVGGGDGCGGLSRGLWSLSRGCIGGDGGYDGDGGSNGGCHRKCRSV